MITDSIGNYLTSIRNAISAEHKVVQIPASRIKTEITKVLMDQGYILNYKIDESGPHVKIKIALKKFQGVKRRFSVLYNSRNTMVIDDYAHHPKEITMTLDSLKSITKDFLIVSSPNLTGGLTADNVTVFLCLK